MAEFLLFYKLYWPEPELTRGKSRKAVRKRRFFMPMENLLTLCRGNIYQNNIKSNEWV
jgi:hypothetical protein